MRGSWGPNITEIFWPRSYGRQRWVFLVPHGCSTGPWSKLFCVLAFPTTSRLLPSSSVLLALLLAYLPPSSIRRTYITFKLPRSNIDTPQRLRNLFRFPANGNVSLPSGAPPWMAFLAGSKGQNITVDEFSKIVPSAFGPFIIKHA